MSIKFVKEGTKEWTRMWSVLASRYGSRVQACKCCGEVWQYMGTANGYHEFRHRHHPDTNERLYAKVLCMSIQEK